MMFETYPFRVGLMGMLTSQYLTVYVINVLYFITTACVYGYRVVSNKASFKNQHQLSYLQVCNLVPSGGCQIHFITCVPKSRACTAHIPFRAQVDGGCMRILYRHQAYPACARFPSELVHARRDCHEPAVHGHKVGIVAPHAPARHG